MATIGVPRNLRGKRDVVVSAALSCSKLATNTLSTRRRHKAFWPINTLTSPEKPSFESTQPPGLADCSTNSDYSDPSLMTLTPPAQKRDETKMVKERSPERTSSYQYSSPHNSERRPLANISVKMQSPSPKPINDDGLKARPSAPAQPDFGKASPLRNPLQKPAPSIFIPKQKQAQRRSPQNIPQAHSESTDSTSLVARKAFYLPGQRASDAPLQAAARKPFYLPNQRPGPAPAPAYSSALEAAQAFSSQSSGSQFDPECFVIPRPVNPPLCTVPARAPPTFSTLAKKPQHQMHASKGPVVDLTQSGDEDDGVFDPDTAIRESSLKFGEPDPYMYVDSSKANENIKSLLEGAFDDEEDKSRTRLRRRAKQAFRNGDEKQAKSLSNKLQALSVQDKEATLDAADINEDEGEDDGTVEGLNVKLLPHQVEGVAWMIDKEIGKVKVKGTKGGILADDMGLGKTIQSMTLILTNPRPDPDAKPEHKLHKLPSKEVSKSTLVVAPLALIKQWEDEIKTKVAKSHALRVLVHHGPSRTKSAVELKKYDVVITTYQTLTSEHAASDMLTANGSRIGCFGVHWYRLILDEAHSIKNRNAKSTLAACALQSWYRWCLTGTPMQNNLDELQSLIKFLRVRPYNELQDWKQQIIQPMKNGRGWLAMRRLQVFLKIIMKRRTKDVLKKDGALNFGGQSTDNGDAQNEHKPSKNSGMKIVKREVETVECDFDEAEKAFYLRLQSRADKRIEEIKRQKKADYMGALVLLLRLRQACNHPQLIEMAMHKDKDAMTTGLSSQSSIVAKQSHVDDGELDALTELMGGVSVATKHCDVCQIELSRAELEEEAIRCRECNEDLAKMRKRNSGSTEQRRVRNRRVVHDSDDEDEGEWIADGPEQRFNLGKAGGSEDEDAEGGGESLGSIDSERSTDEDEDDEDSPPRARIRRRPTVKLEAESKKSDDNEEVESEGAGASSESDSESSLLDGLQLSGKSRGKPSTKIRQLLRILHAESAKHKTIVFSQFTSMLDLIEPHLQSCRLRFARYDGSMRPDAREASLHSLRQDPKCRILLCSLKCGSLGLNLTAASRVVIVEPFWNPFVEEQAIDRVHRLNQTVDVKVYRLTVRNTVEAEILNLQERKRELASAAIEGGSKAGVNKLSMQDILSLFRHDAEHSMQHHEEDRELWEKFGNDHRLLDGPSAGSDHASTLMQRDPRMKKAGGKEKLFKEHDVFGRRW